MTVLNRGRAHLFSKLICYAKINWTKKYCLHDPPLFRSRPNPAIIFKNGKERFFWIWTWSKTFENKFYPDSKLQQKPALNVTFLVNYVPFPHPKIFPPSKLVKIRLFKYEHVLYLLKANFHADLKWQ